MSWSSIARISAAIMFTSYYIICLMSFFLNLVKQPEREFLCCHFDFFFSSLSCIFCSICSICSMHSSTDRSEHAYRDIYITNEYHRATLAYLRAYLLNSRDSTLYLRWTQKRQKHARDFGLCVTKVVFTFKKTQWCVDLVSHSLSLSLSRPRKRKT